MCMAARVPLVLTYHDGGRSLGLDRVCVLAEHGLRSMLRHRFPAGFFSFLLVPALEENPAQSVIGVDIMAGLQFAANQLQGSIQVPVLIGIDQREGSVAAFAV